jgi:hypothetical protein
MMRIAFYDGIEGAIGDMLQRALIDARVSSGSDGSCVRYLSSQFMLILSSVRQTVAKCQEDKNASL